MQEEFIHEHDIRGHEEFILMTYKLDIETFDWIQEAFKTYELKKKAGE